MRTVDVIDYMLLTLAVIALAATLFACTKPADIVTCPGYERVTGGSGCRDKATGQFAEMHFCDEPCDEVPPPAAP